MKGRRGRPRQANAKRRCTTRAGRKTGFDAVDRGTDQLRDKKRIATGRQDLPLGDPAAVLFARDLLDKQQFDRVAEIGELLRRLARLWGIGQADAGGVWAALLAAASRPTRFGPMTTTPAGGEAARRRLEHLLRRLDGNKALVLELAERRVSPLIVRAWQRQLGPRDAVVLERLRKALDRLPAPRRAE